MKKINVNNVDFHYQIIGNGEQEVVLISGYTSDITMWKYIAEQLAQLNPNLKILLFDPQGSGQTIDQDEALTSENLARNTRDLYKALNFTKPTVGGFAFGSGVALHLAKDFPEDIKGLILVAGTLRFNDQAIDWCETLCKEREDGSVEAFKRAAELLYDHCFNAAFKQNNPREAFTTNLGQQITHTQTAQGHRRQFEAVKHYDARGWGHQVNCQHALVICPEIDEFTPPEECQLLADAIGGSLQIIKGAGHALLLEDPDTLVTLMNDYLSKQSISA